MSVTRSFPLTAACFDFDGVIVDSEPLHLESERQTLATRGISFGLIEKAMFVGGTVRGTVERICTHYGIDDIDSFFSERQLVFNTLVESELKLLPGAISLLTDLQASGVPLALVSSGHEDYIDLVLTKFNLHEIFDVIVSEQDVKRHKPDPQPYLLATNSLHATPRACLAVEDSPTGIRSAHSAGLFCIAVPSQATAQEDLSLADLKMSTLREFDENLISRLFLN